MLGKFSTIIWNVFSYLFFSASSGIPIILMLICLLLSQKSLRLSLLLFIFCYLFCSALVISTILLSSLLICSTSDNILLICYDIVYCRLSILNSSRTLLNFSCIFSSYASILFPEFWMIFAIIALNSIPDRLLISSSFAWSYGFLPCCSICCVLLCFLIPFILLFLEYPFCMLEGHGSS